MSGRRGATLLQVIVAGAFLSAAAAAWSAATSTTYAHAVRGHDRGRARAVAQAGWEHARAALAAGRDATCRDAPVLDGRVCRSGRRRAGPGPPRRGLATRSSAAPTASRCGRGWW
ncbi:MAG: hypothetical protein KF878_31760 [Planctomycetes bacterium]|nr:hypothetical protein [Planctomycetota bacterium]